MTLSLPFGVSRASIFVSFHFSQLPHLASLRKVHTQQRILLFIESFVYSSIFLINLWGAHHIVKLIRNYLIFLNHSERVLDILPIRLVLIGPSICESSEFSIDNTWKLVVNCSLSLKRYLPVKLRHYEKATKSLTC